MAELSSEIDEDRDYYAELGLPPTAEAGDIKRNYRKLALKVHPDQKPEHEKTEAHVTFCRIKEAYEILYDPVKRALYDGARPHNNRGPSNRRTSEYPTTRERNQASAETPLWPKNQRQRYYGLTKSKAEANNGAPTTAAGGKRRAPNPPPRRTASTRQRAGASFGSSTNGSHPLNNLRDEPPARCSNYRSPGNSSRYASTPIPDASAQAPSPVPQRPSPAVKTGPPEAVNPHTMDKGNTPPATSTLPHQPPEFPFRQPAQTMSSHHPFEPPEQPQQRALKFPTPPTAPQIPVPNEKEPISAIDWETYLADFKNYLEQWNLFKSRITAHYAARITDITNQSSRSDNIGNYYNCLVLDDDVRNLFIAAGEEHEKRFREFMSVYPLSTRH